MRIVLVNAAVTDPFLASPRRPSRNTYVPQTPSQRRQRDAAKATETAARATTQGKASGHHTEEEPPGAVRHNEEPPSGRHTRGAVRG